MNKKDILGIIAEEKELYVGSNYAFQKRTLTKRYMIWKYLSCFRKTQYYKYLTKTTDGIVGILSSVKYRCYSRKKNRLSSMCGVEIADGCSIGRRLDIWHSGVVINCNLGNDCVFHGNNIVGNKGIGRSEEKPCLGNNVDIGAGAVIIGNIKIADNCTIGANAVVTKSFTESGSVIVGIPGKLKSSQNNL